MKILNYIAVLSMPFFYACTKAEPEASLLYAQVAIGNRTGATLQLSADDGPVQDIPTSGLGLQLLPGNHRFTFVKNGQPLLDTTLEVPALSQVPAIEYALFQPDPTAALQIWSVDALGMNTVATPPSGYFTISIINTDKQLPDVVDVHFYADIWANGQPQPVEVGMVKGVSRKAFTPFTNIKIGGGNAANFPSKVFSVRVTDPDTGATLQSFGYENKITYIAPETPICFIYTAYLAGNNLNSLLEK